MSHLTGKTILVTGAGGSIGSEICRQLMWLNPKQVILFDNSELALYNIDRELSVAGVSRLLPLLGDITRADDVGRAMQQNVDVVFHAAAYKHVTLCEKNSDVAYRVNVEGTRTVIGFAQIWKVPTLVLVSTDKAVRPTCVMGCTKEVAELLVRKAGYTIIRLGNVRGSSGSVLPLWREQIAAGQPVTITDPSATRYFISAQVAAQRIIESSILGPGTFVPDMGRPELLGELAVVYGAREFNIIGLRSGEKKHEELFAGPYTATKLPGLYREAA